MTAGSQTFTGERFDRAAPHALTFRIIDIAHHLSMICRFGGACSTFYSVAEHSIRVSRHVPKSLALPALMHDAAEAYISDIVSPQKSAAVAREERALLGLIFCQLDISSADAPAIHEADRRMFATEWRHLMKASLIGSSPVGKPVFMMTSLENKSGISLATVSPINPPQS